MLVIVGSFKVQLERFNLIYINIELLPLCHLQLNQFLIGQFIIVHTCKLAFVSAYIVINLVLLKKQISLGVLILTILLEGLVLCKSQDIDSFAF